MSERSTLLRETRHALLHKTLFYARLWCKGFWQKSTSIDTKSSNLTQETQKTQKFLTSKDTKDTNNFLNNGLHGLNSKEEKESRRFAAGQRKKNSYTPRLLRKKTSLFGRICNPTVLGIGICNPATIPQCLFYRISNAYIQCWRIANPPEQGFRIKQIPVWCQSVFSTKLCFDFRDFRDFCVR